MTDTWSYYDRHRYTHNSYLLIICQEVWKCLNMKSPYTERTGKAKGVVCFVWDKLCRDFYIKTLEKILKKNFEKFGIFR